MASKNFTSILFSSRKLQIVKLTNDKKRVLKIGSTDLPEGLIKDYVVTDKTLLSQHVKHLLTQTGINEKNVGIIVPEFSTYTKLLKLPSLLGDKEFDEAVRWQAREFVPSNDQDIVMDWKIVSADTDARQVLLVAIDKNVLTGYVDAVSQAGCYPVVVETQSLALTRFTSHENVNSLVIYSNFGEAILMVLSGAKILGSSVVPGTNQNLIINTASEMVKHYSTEGIKKIVVCGFGFSQQVYESLKAMLKVNLEGIHNSLSGTSDAEFQEYLLPISQQLEDPFEPSDERTVNLLPPDWIKKYSYERLSKRIWSLLIVSSLVLWSACVVVIGNYMLLKNRLSTLKDQNVGQESMVNGVVAQIEAINNRINSVNSIKDVQILPQEVINKITEAKPLGIDISRHTLDLDKGVLKVQGRAQKRDDLILFKNNLEAYEKFKEVRIPISTLEKEIDVDFEITFLYEGLSENKPLKIKINQHEKGYQNNMNAGQNQQPDREVRNISQTNMPNEKSKTIQSHAVVKKETSTKSLFTKAAVVGFLDLIAFFMLIYYIGQTPFLVDDIKQEVVAKISTSDESVQVLEQQIVSNKTKIDYIESLFHDEAGVVEFIKQIDILKSQGYVTNFEFRINNANGGSIKDKTKASGIPFVIEFSGDENNISQGLQRLESLPYIIRAINVTVDKNIEGQFVLTYGGFLYVEEGI